MKFKEVFPDIKRDEYDFPNLPWKYSEMVTEAILNSKEVANVLNVRENCCYNFNRDIIDKLSNIFASSIPIEEKIKSGYELISNTNL